MSSLLVLISLLLQYIVAKDILPCKYNNFPLVLGAAGVNSRVRHLDYRASDETLVAAGEVGTGTGIAIFRPSK